MGPGPDAPPLGDPHLLDELAANAWPAFVVQVVDGWRFRFTPGVRARRSNSVLPLTGRDEVPLADRTALVDEFHARWGATVRYQISPAAQPRDVDSLLTERGFQVEAPVHVQTAALDDVLHRTAAPAPAPVGVAEEVDHRWLTTTCELFQRSDADTMRHRILDRIGPRVAYALLDLDGVPAAVGMGVLERGWLGIYSMGTKRESRRQGRRHGDPQRAGPLGPRPRCPARLPPGGGRQRPGPPPLPASRLPDRLRLSLPDPPRAVAKGAARRPPTRPGREGFPG
jgi:hypothetical protein